MKIHSTLRPDDVEQIVAELSEANHGFMRRYPGESNRRQAVHTVYGGAHLFRADSAQKLGEVALCSFEEYAPNPRTLARALKMDASLAAKVYPRIGDKLRREPVEDFRLDFEDGYGNRPDAEEDGHAASSAEEMARGFSRKTLPPFIGIRIKPMNEDLRERSTRTLDIFVTTLLRKNRRKVAGEFRHHRSEDSASGANERGRAFVRNS